MSDASLGNSNIPKLFHISKTVEKSIKDVYDGMEGRRRVYPTSWPRLNRNLMGGLQPGKMYVVAGRPGVGKSAFSNQLIFDVLDVNKTKQNDLIVIYWSFEMPGEQQILRAGSKDTKLQTFDLLSVETRLTNDRYEQYKQAVQKYKDYPMYFCSIPQDMTIIKKVNEQMFMRHPSKTVINLIDHSRLVLGRRIQNYRS